ARSRRLPSADSATSPTAKPRQYTPPSQAWPTTSASRGLGRGGHDGQTVDDLDVRANARGLVVHETKGEVLQLGRRYLARDIDGRRRARPLRDVDGRRHRQPRE